MRKIFVIVLSFFVLATLNAQPQKKDEAKFVEPKSGFWQEILEGIEDFNKEDKPAKKSFSMDFADEVLPTSKEEFEYYWHNEPVSQGRTGTCWSFSTTSYFESEVFRLSDRKVKLSEMWTAYWEYVEKAKYFVQTRGSSLFAEGSEANAVTRIWKKYGVVPLESYTGLLPGQKFHDHQTMFDEMETFLNSVKEQNAWNEEAVVETIKSILDRYMQKPPEKILLDGEEITPQQYLNDYLKLKLEDYVDILSIKEQPYYEYVEYTVPDNWWHSEDYLNVPLDHFMKIVKYALSNGFSIVIGGDVSEPGYDSHAEVAMIPTWDIPSEYIDENARQFRFDNGTTTDDHGIHMVGHRILNDDFWFLIKDSGAGSRNGSNKGYYFYHEDYVKLKIMDFMVHKDAVGDLLENVK